VSGLLAMSARPWKGEIFNLGTGQNYSLNQVARMFKDAAVKYIPARPGEMRETLADIEHTKELLNWRPEKCLTEYCAAITRNC
jgi:nucleoside-diphosphate-sugar epimerase